MTEDQAIIPVIGAAAAISSNSILDDVAGQLSVKSQRIYRHDAAVFATWLQDHDLTPHMLTKSYMIAYRSYLKGRYKNATASRMLSVARRLLAEQVERNHLEHNPAATVRGIKAEDETTHVALTRDQAQDLLDAIETTTLLGLRNFLRLGLRRSEAIGLRICDLSERQGHHVAIIQHGKGDKRRIAKIPVDVWREIERYLQMLREVHAARSLQLLGMLDLERGLLDERAYQARRQEIVELHTMHEQDALFVQIRRGTHPTREPLGEKAVERIITRLAETIQVEGLTPHGLRASFITLALESGASLHQVQYAAGHKDPRTTERYQKRKVNLDDNAVDFVKIQRQKKNSSATSPPSQEKNPW